MFFFPHSHPLLANFPLISPSTLRGSFSFIVMKLFVVEFMYFIFFLCTVLKLDDIYVFSFSWNGYFAVLRFH